MTESLATVAYIGAIILFILSLVGLSNPETARRGNLFGMLGMAIAVLATVLGPRVTSGGIATIVIALVIGGAVGLYAAKKVQMTQMPELVALMHSLVGLAACLVGFASYVDTSVVYQGAEKTIHLVEIYVGILIDRIELIDAVAENLPVPDASIDTIVLTWTLCSLDDAPAALAEMRRVLRPGGALLFCEHGLAPDAAVARWQRRLTPAWRRIAGNCHLDRDVPGLLDAAGFRLDEVETGYLGGPRPLTWMTSGLARPAG